MLDQVIAPEPDAAPANGDPALEVGLSPHQNPIRLARDALDESRKQAQIVLYKFDERSLRKAVVRALGRGVAVQLLADADAARGRGSFVTNARRAGAEVRIWTRGKLHAKFAILDRERVISGSFNWTDSARRQNLELTLDFRDEPTVSRFIHLFRELWVGARPFRYR